MREELELFAHNLNVYMNKYGLNQLELAEKLGKSTSIVNDWCHAKKFPRLSTLDEMTKLFNCKRSDLLERYTTEESIKASEIENEINDYMTKLNADGLEHLLQYFKDLNPKFFKGGEENVQ